MCDPITMVTFAIGAAQQVAGHVAASGAADVQNAMYEQNRLNAIQDGNDKSVALQQRQMQEEQSASMQKFDALKEGRKIRAEAENAAGEGNVSGVSVDAVMRDLFSQQSGVTDRIDQQTEWSQNQFNNELKQVHAQTRDRINSVQRGQKPSLFGTGLAIGAQGLSAYGDYKVRKARGY